MYYNTQMGDSRKNWGFFAQPTWPLKSIYSLEIGWQQLANTHTSSVCANLQKLVLKKSFLQTCSLGLLRVINPLNSKLITKLVNFNLVFSTGLHNSQQWFNSIFAKAPNFHSLLVRRITRLFCEFRAVIKKVEKQTLYGQFLLATRLVYIHVIAPRGQDFGQVQSIFYHPIRSQTRERTLFNFAQLPQN